MERFSGNVDQKAVKVIMRRAQNLKKSPTGFDKTAVFYSVASKQVGDFFKFLWPFQKSWTLLAFYNVVHSF